MEDAIDADTYNNDNAADFDALREVGVQEMEKRVREAAESRMQFNVDGSVIKVEEDCKNIVFKKVQAHYSS